MRLVKKWLLPVLTCLIVAGAAFLPRQVSQAQDARLFGQVHAETLDADSLSAREAPTLLDRMEVYSSQYSSAHPVLSFRDYSGFDGDTAFKEQEPLMQTAQELLTGAGVLPSWIFEEAPFEEKAASRLLLWDPAASETFQEPSTFWELHWSYSSKYHSKDISVHLDAETGLPVYLWVFDTNISQWLPYQWDDLRALAGRFFDLLELDVQEIDYLGPSDEIQLKLRYSIAGTAMSFDVTRTPTALTIQLDSNWRNRTDAGSIPDSYSYGYGYDG